MLRTKTKIPPAPPTNGISAVPGCGGDSRPMDWEMRPGGMLVQKRTDSDKNSAAAPTIRVRVKYGSVYHDVQISSQATFGELKKMLVGPTGLHHEDQKVIYKEKERDSKAFLDVCGIKNGSKMVVVEDPIRQEKRLLEMRNNAKTMKASNTISQISLEVDRLAGQVSALESVIGKGGKVAEKTVLNLIELLMDQLLKLDGIMGDGNVKLQRKMQVRRVQKYVETLDILKIKNQNQTPMQVQQRSSDGPKQAQTQAQAHDRHVQQTTVSNGHDQSRHPTGHSSSLVPERKSTSETVVTTKWEIFDAMTPLVPASSSSSEISAGNSNNHVQPKFNWEFFD
ncbi:BAG family molecular chaperone regulator 3-like [Momordica charantia]|uniref:BAG family molecular chaperone regulator 3-like n=1 Tax=Momordica charantia TaxID=3673 RepID=A0A6J1DNI6_MOMCH|nr:BAG family molecular chaperone regulator 3-like [Momordica charantia]